MTRGGEPLHVLHVTAPAQFGGLESVVEILSSGLVRRGVRNTAICVLDREQPDHPFVSALTATGTRAVPLVIGARAYLREARSLMSLIRETDPDVVHTHGYRSDVIGGYAARRTHRPAVSTLHGFTASTWKGSAIEWLQLRRLRTFDAVVAVSPGIAERAQASGLPAVRIHLIPNAWGGSARLLDRAAARAELGIPTGAFVVGWIGRLSAEKGADIFLDAFSRWEQPETFASIIGDGRERQALERLATALGLGQRVRWHGVRQKAGRLLRAFDALALSSRTEGVPMVVLEAMHAGTPLVVTNVGGIPSILNDTQAFLVPPESPEAFSAALAQLHSNPSAARERAERAAAQLDRAFAVSPWLDRYLHVYAIARGGRNARRG